MTSKGVYVDSRKQLNISKEAKEGRWSGAGMYGNVIYGVPYSVASSALQKAVRRGQDAEAVQWALGMYWNGGAAVTNTWNRLLVMAVEDVGPGNIWALPAVYRLYTTDDDNEDYRLAIAAGYLAQSPKTRINDWACYYHLAKEIKDVEKYYRSYLSALKKKDINSILTHITDLAFSEKKLPKDLKKELGVKVQHVQILIWEGFYHVIPQSKYLDMVYDIALMKTWNSKSDRKGKTRLLYSHVAILWALSTFPNDSDGSFKLNLKEGISKVKRRVEEVRSLKGLLGVPDYAYDKHTREGKSLKRGIKHFIEEAAKLEDEADVWKSWSDYFLGHFKKNMIKE